MDKKSLASLVTILVAVVLGALVAIAGSVGGSEFGGWPIFALAVAAAFIVQIVVYVPSMVARTERFFDATGSLTFIVITVAVALHVPQPDLRTWVLAAMVVVWALRLGTFLFVRIHRSGSDDRFDDIKTHPMQFLRVWVLQGAWVSITASAAWIAMTSTERAPLDAWLIVGAAIWLGGIIVEVVADTQKTVFRANPANRDAFIHTGLWSRSRHPNYFGEIVLWVGVFVAAFPVLSGWQFVAVLSPLFVILLLTKASGIPLLEAKADRRWGNDADYQRYKARTPVLIPRLTSLR